MQNYWNLYLACKQQQLYGPVNYPDFRETGHQTAVHVVSIFMAAEKKERSKQMLFIPGERTCKTQAWR